MWARLEFSLFLEWRTRKNRLGVEEGDVCPHRFHDSDSLVGEPSAQPHLEEVMDDDNVGRASGDSKSNGKFLKKQKKLWVLVLVARVLVRLDGIGSAGCCLLGFTQAAYVYGCQLDLTGGHHCILFNLWPQHAFV